MKFYGIALILILSACATSENESGTEIQCEPFSGTECFNQPDFFNSPGALDGFNSPGAFDGPPVGGKANINGWDVDFDKGTAIGPDGTVRNFDP